MATIYTQVGEEKVIDLIDGTTAVHLDATNAKVGWGTGAGTAVKGSTALFVEASEARVAPAVTQPLVDKLQWLATMTCAGAPKTITNAGLFDAATVGNLVIHGDFTGIALNIGDKIEFTFTHEQT